MTTEWKDITDPEELFRLKREGWEIEFQTARGEWISWTMQDWSFRWNFRARPRQPKITVELPVADVVRLQNAADGLWAHFRVGKGYAYSLNLDADKMGNRFANEYRAAVGSDAPQPKMKKVKTLCYINKVSGSIMYRFDGEFMSTDWIHQPKLDLEGEIPE